MSRPITFTPKQELIKTWIPEQPKYSNMFENWWVQFCNGKNEVTLDKTNCWLAWCAALSYIDETITILPVDRRQ